MDRGEGSSPGRPKRFGRIDPFCWIPVVSLLTIAALMVVSGAAPFGVGLVAFALLLLLFDSWVNRPDPRPARVPAADPNRVRDEMRPREDNRPLPPHPERPRNGPPPPPMRNHPMPPRQQPPRMDPRAMPRQPPLPPPPRGPGPRSGAGA
jgi:hypothetical protein